MNAPDLPPLVLIAGPTASGKSALALALAERIGGTIINADASQVYADLRVLTARPSAQEEALAPHRLFGHVDAALAHNAAIWAREARSAIADIHSARGVPILVGGSGLYLRTLLEGLAPVPEIPAAVRAEVRALAVADAYAALVREDADAARRLRASDTTRVARALEVVRSTGRTLGEWQRDRVGGIAEEVRLLPALLLPDRDTLAARIDMRVLTMLDDGAAAEVAALVARALDPALPAMRAIGVREIAAWQEGRVDRATMVARVQAASRRYAKRQRTWFRHQAIAGTTLLTSRMQSSDRTDDSNVTTLREKLLTR